MGASLLPDYFAEKVNVFIAIAPVASTANIPVKGVRLAAHHWKMIEFWLVDVFNIYNFAPPLPHIEHAYVKICSANKLFSAACKAMIKLFINPEVDDLQSAENAASNLPAGDSWRSVVYYA